MCRWIVTFHEHVTQNKVLSSSEHKGKFPIPCIVMEIIPYTCNKTVNMIMRLNNREHLNLAPEMSEMQSVVLPGELTAHVALVK